jgi:hypothetical protein
MSGCSSCSKGTDKGGVDASGPKATQTGISVTPPPSALPPPLPPQGDVDGFQGNIEMKVEAPGLKEPVQLRMIVRGERVSYEAPNGLAGREAMAIYDVDLRRMVLFNREERTYFVADNPEEDAGGATDAGVTMPLKPTGRKDKVGGMQCDVWELAGVKKERTTACIVEGVPFLDYGKLSNTATTPPPWLQAMSGTKRFPARVVQTADDGALLLRFEVTKFAQHPIPAGLVSVPAGFTPVGGRVIGSPLKPGMPN